MPKQNVLKSTKVYKVFCVVNNKNSPLLNTCRPSKQDSINIFIDRSSFIGWKGARKEGWKCIAFNLSQK